MVAFFLLYLFDVRNVLTSTVQANLYVLVQPDIEKLFEIILIMN